MFKNLIFLSLAGLFIAGCQPGLESPSSPTLSLKGTPEKVSEDINSAQDTLEQGSLLKIKPDQKMYAQIKTNLGNMRVQLFHDKAPKTVENFVGLAEGTKVWTDPKTGKKVSDRPLYDGVVFHRIISGFMVQSGDPLGTGTGGPGYEFADESTGESYTRGTLAMANHGPNTNGSQFFIMHQDGGLPPLYTIFGRIDPSDTESLATLDKIASVKTTSNGMGETSKPIETVQISTITIDRQ